MDPAILIIIIFIVAPLLERIFKAKKGEQPPPRQGGQRPGQWPAPPEQRRVPQPRPGTTQRDPTGQRAGPAGARGDDESAAAMLPDDLWEILTGERRPPPRPAAEDDYEPDFGDEVDDAIFAEDVRQEEIASTTEPETWRRSEPAPWETDEPPLAPSPTPPAPRPVQRHQRPVPVPVEPTSPRRPAERAPYVREVPDHYVPQVVSLEALSFDDEQRHDQFHERLEGLAPAARVQRRSRLLAAEQFTNDELRRAIIMAEVLGTPKGLE